MPQNNKLTINGTICSAGDHLVAKFEHDADLVVEIKWEDSYFCVERISGDFWETKLADIDKFLELGNVEVIHKDAAKSKIYSQSSACCKLLSEISKTRFKGDKAALLGEWIVNLQDIKDAGIDCNKIYDLIKRLAKEKKDELDCRLEDLT